MTVRMRFHPTAQGPSRAPGGNHPPETCGHKHDFPTTRQSIAPTHALEHNHAKLQYHQNSQDQDEMLDDKMHNPEETTDFCHRRP